MEMLVSFLLFAFLLMAAMLLLNQARLNLAYAQNGYNAHLAAQNLMLVVRNALGETQELPCVAEAKTAVYEYAARFGVKRYGVWIFTLYDDEIFENSFGASCFPAVNAKLAGLSYMSVSGNASVIFVVIWNEQMYIAGRAIGVQ